MTDSDKYRIQTTSLDDDMIQVRLYPNSNYGVAVFDTIITALDDDNLDWQEDTYFSQFEVCEKYVWFNLNKNRLQPLLNVLDSSVANLDKLDVYTMSTVDLLSTLTVIIYHRGCSEIEKSILHELERRLNPRSYRRIDSKK